jgi:hypothetical protein
MVQMNEVTNELFYGPDFISDEDGERIMEIEDVIDELEQLLDVALTQGLADQATEIENHLEDMEHEKALLEGMYI